MAAKWNVINTEYYLSKNEKEKVIFLAEYRVSDESKEEFEMQDGSKETIKKDYSGIQNFDLEITEGVEGKDAVLYTDKDTLLVDKAVKVGDIKTPAVEAVEAKNPWASVDFVEYDKLTEDIVVGWIKNILGDDKVKEIEDNIAAQIDAQINPPAATKGSGVPW
tara:strand:+ start:110 stop:598 length:489 start_codon:yes stop_codon:yes gene_type:complete